MKTVVKNKLYDEAGHPPQLGKEFANISFLECRFWGSQFIDCTWTECQFKRTSFAHKCSFIGCSFENCRFETAHTWLKGTFENCNFENCDFKAVSIGDVSFKNCRFSGKLEEMIFYGKKAPREMQVILSNVDFTAVKFVETDFRMKVNLKTVQFPSRCDGLYIEGKSATCGSL